MHYLISMKYDGSKFYGFQRLNENPSVQKTLEEALTIINKKEVIIKGAGRTDRGVHAYDQQASFSLDITIDEEHLKLALNSLVKPYIYITKVSIVPNNFHARFRVTGVQTCALPIFLVSIILKILSLVHALIMIASFMILVFVSKKIF